MKTSAEEMHSLSVHLGSIGQPFYHYFGWVNIQRRDGKKIHRWDIDFVKDAFGIMEMDGYWELSPYVDDGREISIFIYADAMSLFFQEWKIEAWI